MYLLLSCLLWNRIIPHCIIHLDNSLAANTFRNQWYIMILNRSSHCCLHFVHFIECGKAEAECHLFFFISFLNSTIFGLSCNEWAKPLLSALPVVCISIDNMQSLKCHFITLAYMGWMCCTLQKHECSHAVPCSFSFHNTMHFDSWIPKTQHCILNKMLSTLVSWCEHCTFYTVKSRNKMYFLD